MRPYLILTAVVLLMTVAAFGQQPFPHPTNGACFYGCGPYIPLVTTPEVSLQTVSPNPVGATNATTGLIAGATDATLSQVTGSTSSVYTEPVWYSGGGAPLTAPQVHLSPEPIGREAHPMFEEHPREEHGRREEAKASWVYFTGREHSAPLGNVAKGKKSDHTYTNDDVTRQNNKNGDVRYDGKTEKL